MEIKEVEIEFTLFLDICLGREGRRMGVGEGGEISFMRLYLEI